MRISRSLYNEWGIIFNAAVNKERWEKKMRFIFKDFDSSICFIQGAVHLSSGEEESRKSGRRRLVSR